MTDVTPNPKARAERLLMRSIEAHEVVRRLAADLRLEEGKSRARGAQEDLAHLCQILEALRERS